MSEKVVCNKCGVTYTDEPSIELTKKWLKEGYAPCSNLPCSGTFELVEYEEQPSASTAKET